MKNIHNSNVVNNLHDEMEYAKEMTHDKVMLSDTWRVKIVAANDILWESKRMRQLLDRMDRQFGDYIYSS
jgi:hypothetical protein